MWDIYLYILCVCVRDHLFLNGMPPLLCEKSSPPPFYMRIGVQMSIFPSSVYLYPLAIYQSGLNPMISHVRIYLSWTLLIALQPHQLIILFAYEWLGRFVIYTKVWVIPKSSIKLQTMYVNLRPYILKNPSSLYENLGHREDNWCIVVIISWSTFL